MNFPFSVGKSIRLNFLEIVSLAVIVNNVIIVDRQYKKFDLITF